MVMLQDSRKQDTATEQARRCRLQHHQLLMLLVLQLCGMLWGVFAADKELFHLFF